MGIPVAILTPESTLRPARFKAESLTQVAQLEPDGVYTVTRTFHQDQVVLLDAHLERLEESARLEGIPISLDRGAVRGALRQMIREAGYSESRFRITIPREQPTQIQLALEPLQLVSPEQRTAGVRVATMPITRRNPRAKTNEWVALRTEAQRSLPAEAYEGIAVNEKGDLIEGFSSNFYAIVEGVLRTADRGMLRGIAREIVLMIAKDAIPFELRAVHQAELSNLQEAFLTSSSRGVLPIVAIDAVTIGAGVPGPVTLDLASRYENWVADHLERI